MRWRKNGRTGTIKRRRREKKRGHGKKKTERYKGQEGSDGSESGMSNGKEAGRSKGQEEHNILLMKYGVIDKQAQRRAAAGRSRHISHGVIQY